MGIKDCGQQQQQNDYVVVQPLFVVGEVSAVPVPCVEYIHYAELENQLPLQSPEILVVSVVVVIVIDVVDYTEKKLLPWQQELEIAAVFVVVVADVVAAIIDAEYSFAVQQFAA